MARRWTTDPGCYCMSSYHNANCYMQTPSGYGLRSHKMLLGSRRMPYEKWARTMSLYTWPLWRNWKPPKSMVVESAEEHTRKAIRAIRPSVQTGHEGGASCIVPYPWKLWHQHKGAVAAHRAYLAARWAPVGAKRSAA